MADAQTLREIAERVEKLTGPSWEADLAIFRAIRPEYAGAEWQPFGPGLRHVNDSSDMRCLPAADATPLRYTVSVDAALTLVPDPEWRVVLDKLPISDGPRWTATIRPHAAEGGWSDYTETAAIAITAAALRALAASQEQRRG